MSSCVYGLCLIGENEFGEFSAIGNGEDSAVNYAEITKEQFMSPSKNSYLNQDNCANDHKQDERDFFQAQRRCQETLFECSKNLNDKNFET